MPFSMMVVATMIGCNPMWQRLQPYVEEAATLWVRAVLHDGGGHHDVDVAHREVDDARLHA